MSANAIIIMNCSVPSLPDTEMAQERSHLVIRNGRVIDPANEFDGPADVEIENGKIVSVRKDLGLPVQPAVEEFDASGCIVVPGLIDLHTHVYQYATPLGVSPDESCLARGVTTVVDAGSAGAGTFEGLRKFISAKSKTRVLAFVHIASHGLTASGCASGANGGECDSLNQVDADLCAKCILENKDMAVGIKIRLSKSVANDGKSEEEAYRRALQASSVTKTPLMVHFCHSSIPIDSSEGDKTLACPGSLQKGDILTHMLHAHRSSIIDPQTKMLYPSVLRARQKGVLFDVGHGFGSFSWTVAELCAQANFFPDIISTDLHTESHEGPAYDLTMIMTKLIHVGMPLYDVIKAVTMTPASAVGWGDRIGSLSPNIGADVTVLKIQHADLQVEDCQGQIRKVKKQIIPVAVWRDGVGFEIRKPDPLPGRNTAKLIGDWDSLVVKDNNKPAGLN